MGQALGIVEGQIRDEWAAYDLDLPNGVKIEVKSAAYIQSWSQKDYSKIIFNVPKTRALDLETGNYSQEPKHQADLYIFAVLAHKDQASIDPLNVDQWMFYVLTSKDLNERKRSQHSITLKSLIEYCPAPIRYNCLKQAVEAAAPSL